MQRLGAERSNDTVVGGRLIIPISPLRSCPGCGRSPMTKHALERMLHTRVPEDDAYSRCPLTILVKCPTMCAYVLVDVRWCGGVEELQLGVVRVNGQ